MAYTGPIASFGCVFRNAAGDGEGKADGGSDFFIVFPTGTTSVKDGEGVTHNTGVIAPNPVSAITTINYTVLDKPQMMSVAIYDLQGNLVRTLVNEFQQPGNQIVLWNCDNNSGEIVANGMYMYRISSNGFVTSRPIVVQR
jgi:flagellar hook assembly protein FlgD